MHPRYPGMYIAIDSWLLIFSFELKIFVCRHASIRGIRNRVCLSVPRENSPSFVNISPIVVIDSSMERFTQVLHHGKPKNSIDGTAISCNPQTFMYVPTLNIYLCWLHSHLCSDKFALLNRYSDWHLVWHIDKLCKFDHNRVINTNLNKNLALISFTLYLWLAPLISFSRSYLFFFFGGGGVVP